MACTILPWALWTSKPREHRYVTQLCSFEILTTVLNLCQGRAAQVRQISMAQGAPIVLGDVADVAAIRRGQLYRVIIAM